MSEIFDDLKEDEGMAEAMEALKQFQSNDRLRLAALARERAVRAYNSSVKHAREEGERLGREEGERLGREEGLEKGEVLGQLKSLLTLRQQGVLPKEHVENQMKTLLNRGYDNLVSDYLEKLKDC